MLTKNFADLRAQVEAHLAADKLVKGQYWEDRKGCFIGCLAHEYTQSGCISKNEETYSLPAMVQILADNIFEGLTVSEGREFFAAFPDAVGTNGKDLSDVGWLFLIEELRALPPQTGDVKMHIDRVIDGLELISGGKEWPGATKAATSAAFHARAITQIGRASCRERV